MPASEISITQNFDFLSMKFAAAGPHSKAEPQSHDETGVLRAKGFFLDKIAAEMPYTAAVYDLVSVVPGLCGPGSKPSLELQVGPFDAAKDRTRCFKTEHGAVCQGPAAARVGDFVVILFGGKHLFVVRSCGGAQAVGDASGKQDVGGRAGGEGQQSDAFICELVGPCIHPTSMFGTVAKRCQERPEVFSDFVLV